MPALSQRFAPFLIFLVCLFIHNAMVGAQAAAEAQPALQQRLEQIFFDEPHQLRGNPIYTMGPLLDLYRKNDFQPLWTRHELVAELGKALLAAADEGLNPTDYHLESVNTALAEGNWPASPRQAMDWDILFSDALILLGEHILHGKVDGRDVEEKEGLAAGPPPEVDVDYYLHILRTGEIAAAMAARAPQHPNYQALKRGLAQYREIASLGGWPTVPEGPSLKPGMTGKRVTALRQRLVASGDLAADKAEGVLYDAELVAAVQSFQDHYGLEVDGISGKNTIAAMNRSVEERIEQICANLERTRWILHDMPASALLVDIAGFQLHYRHNGELRWSSRVMVGQPYHQTPVFRSAITYLVLNPTWTIPPGMLKNETIPNILKDRSYLNRENLKVYDLQGAPIDPNSIEWSRYLDRGFPYLIRQDAGPDNALGRIKFMFPNPFHVYLHDTPAKSLFGRNSRALSQGCIRVQSPLDLGRMLLANDPGNTMTETRFDEILASGKTTGLSLNNPLPVFLLYATAKGNADGSLSFNPDVYNRDAAVIEALKQPPRALLQKPLIAASPPGAHLSEIPVEETHQPADSHEPEQASEYPPKPATVDG